MRHKATHITKSLKMWPGESSIGTIPQKTGFIRMYIYIDHKPFCPHRKKGRWQSIPQQKVDFQNTMTAPENLVRQWFTICSWSGDIEDGTPNKNTSKNWFRFESGDPPNKNTNLDFRYFFTGEAQKKAATFSSTRDMLWTGFLCWHIFVCYFGDEIHLLVMTYFGPQRKKWTTEVMGLALKVVGGCGKLGGCFGVTHQVRLVGNRQIGIRKSGYFRVSWIFYPSSFPKMIYDTDIFWVYR